MIVYGSYLSKKEDIPKASLQTAFFDTIAAMLSALAIMRQFLHLELNLQQDRP